MRKRGSKPKNKVEIEWSPEFAYAIGLLATDGNLSPDGRHINFTSKDSDLVFLFKKCLGLSNKIGRKARGSSKEKKYYVIQFGDVNFYEFLLSVGLLPNKSKILAALDIPNKYFFDFLRGHLDGDGSFHSYFDPRWRSSYMFYTIFMSASKKHIEWLREGIESKIKIRGHVSKSATDSTFKLKYAKNESLKLLPRLYYNKKAICLPRKRIKIEKALRIEGCSL
jgi:hypothetical protein